MSVNFDYHFLQVFFYREKKEGHRRDQNKKSLCVFTLYLITILLIVLFIILFYLEEKMNILV